ncbi:MAG: glutamate-cysteine ligase family protein [Bacteriovoracales bacterium]|nr:glutamate-cysteine ligase family protein [Bacteriovoracales bacterium]
MGRQLKLKDFTPKDYEEFSIRLHTQLQELREGIKGSSFNKRHFSLGAELEVYLVDDEGRPANVNEEILEAARDPRLTPEINRYNLELNFTPVDGCHGALFNPLEKEMYSLFDTVQGHARKLGADIVPIGILPTLEKGHLEEGSMMTDRDRYHALRKSLCGPEDKPYKINITGLDTLTLSGKGVCVEGANTSFQIHLRLPADEFTDYFNAAQLATPLFLALSANSPLVLGHRLWQESRIALFKQSVDFRDHENPEWKQPSRVSFGYGWARKEAWELFMESVALYPPLLPVINDLDESDSTTLFELCLHHGTIWPWNRAVYGAGDEGHLRIEFRSLPAGPSIVDMMANAVLAIGLTLGFKDTIDYYSARLPFRFAEYNFYRAAQRGLGARLIWPKVGQGGVLERPITDIIQEFLPVAREGLKRLETCPDEIDRLWKIVEQRFEKRTTGAKWQLDRFEHYRKNCSVEESCHRMLVDYRNNMMARGSVVDWC